MRRLVALALLCGCGGSGGTHALYGEVHVHGFPGGSHPGALFVKQAVPAAQVAGDELIPDLTASASDGACTLSESNSTGRRGSPALVDAGPVHITGGANIPDVELRDSSGSYLPATPVSGAIFAGGETLHVAGDGAQAPAFAGALEAPLPLVLTAPAGPGLGTGDFTVAWVAGSSTRVAITLIVSTADGRFALAQCIADDAAAQSVVPAALIAQMPAPPRDVQLEVSRDRIVWLPSAAGGLAVIAHAGFEVSVGWHED
jgi:hypothetical protein